MNRKKVIITVITVVRRGVGGKSNKIPFLSLFPKALFYCSSTTVMKHLNLLFLVTLGCFFSAILLPYLEYIYVRFFALISNVKYMFVKWSSSELNKEHPHICSHKYI